MPAKALYMETTQVPAVKTAGEISTLLVASGARSIATEYGEGASIVGLKFELVIEGAPVSFALPVRVEPIYQTLLQRKNQGRSLTPHKAIRAQAERVAWRQLLRWVQAQLAMIDVQMVKPQEVFLPYLLPHPGSKQTLYDFFQQDGLKQLTAGSVK